MKSMTIKSIAKAAVLGMVISLTGCLSPVKVEPQSTYMLNSVPYNVPKRGTHSATLLVMLSDTAAAYNTVQMAYSLRPYHIAYYGQNSWAETPAQMLQPLIVQTLSNTHYFKAVVAAPYVGRYDYVLTTQIDQLLQDYTHKPAQVRFIVRAQLTRASSNQLLASKQFTVSERLQTYTPYGGVYAANRATSRILEQLSAFVITNVE